MALPNPLSPHNTPSHGGTQTYTDLNEGHIEYTFFVLAGTVLVDLVLYMFVSRGFVYAHEQKHAEEEDNVYAAASRRGSAVSAR